MLEILDYVQTPLGVLCLRRRELLCEEGTVVTEVTLDHEFLMSSYLTESERALSRVSLDRNPGAELDVLVGGLGLGYTAREVLRSERVQRVEVVELLPPVLSWVERGLVPLAGELRADERLVLTEGDVYARLAGEPERRHDLILIDVDHSPDDRLGPGNQAFYTEVGLRAAREHLRPGGVLAVWSYAESSPFATAMAAVFDDLHVEPVTAWNPLIEVEQTDWLFVGKSVS